MATDKKKVALKAMQVAHDAKPKAKAPAEHKSGTLYYSTHNLGGLKPPVSAFTVFDPENHRTRDNKPVKDKIKEFQERGLLNIVLDKSEVGATVNSKGKRNSKGALSEGAKARTKK